MNVSMKRIWIVGYTMSILCLECDTKRRYGWPMRMHFIIRMRAATIFLLLMDNFYPIYLKIQSKIQYFFLLFLLASFHFIHRISIRKKNIQSNWNCIEYTCFAVVNPLVLPLCGCAWWNIFHREFRSGLLAPGTFICIQLVVMPLVWCAWSIEACVCVRG